MLGIIRKHVGWGLKVVLVVVIVTFVFFFGYNKLSKQGRESTALEVGDETIPFAKFNFFYNNQYENAKKSFKDAEIPDFLLQGIRQNTQQLLVHRVLLSQFAESLGMQVTDLELASVITSEKDFDPVAYKNFINNFFYRNGFSYESLIREDTLIQKFQDWVQNTEKTSDIADPFRWTFEIATVEGKEKKELALTIQKIWSEGKEALPLLKKNRIPTRKIGPISIKERSQIFPAGLSLEQYAAIFSLTKPKSALQKPIEENNRFLLVRLRGKEEGPQDKKNNPSFYPLERLADFWFQDFAKKAKVKSFTKAEDL